MNEWIFDSLQPMDAQTHTLMHGLGCQCFIGQRIAYRSLLELYAQATRKDVVNQ